MNFKIIHERHKCIGCGACTLSSNWEMKDDNKVIMKGMSYKKTKKEGKETETGEKEIDELGDNLDAAQSCPVNCITIINNTGEKLI